MPKITEHKGFRSHVRRGRHGQVRVYYYYDQRSKGEPDIPLGRDYPAALRRYKELVEDAPAKAGRLQEAIERFRIDEELGLPSYESNVTRRGYAQALKQLEGWAGKQRWEDITLPAMREYLDKRTAKRQGNLEMSVLSIVWGRARLWNMTKLPFPAHGLKNWKNKEQARRLKVTEQLFDAIYVRGDRVLRDCMDIATATGLRLTDCRTVEMPDGDVLTVENNSKTGKSISFRITPASVLLPLLQRRRCIDAEHPYLLSTPTGAAVSERMLNERWAIARAAAAEAAEQAGDAKLAKAIRAALLRDMRKRAGQLAPTEEAAKKLLQHDDVRITRRHYRPGGDVIDPVR